MKSIGRWLLISSLGCLGAYAPAQGAEEAETPEQAEPASTPTAKSTERPPGAKPNPEIFVPTEEISEDFAVSFPVDI